MLVIKNKVSYSLSLATSDLNLTLVITDPSRYIAVQIDRDEVRLRRTITKSKDEYHLDKKPIK